MPPYKAAYLALLRQLHNAGVTDINGHLIYAISDDEYAETDKWLTAVGLTAVVNQAAKAHLADGGSSVDKTLDTVADKFIEVWEAEAGLKTLGQAVADLIVFRQDEGVEVEMSVDEWNEFASTASWYRARNKADELLVNPVWNPELAKTPEGYYQIQGGVQYAIAKSLAVAPFADLLWMETKTAELEDAQIGRAHV